MKLNVHIFSIGNRVRGIKSGKVYNVVEADLDLGFAFIKDAEGKLKVVDWMYPSGAIKQDLLKNYELVKKHFGVEE
jgi:hypothetical protein